jgi:hypothetical protein
VCIGVFFTLNCGYFAFLFQGSDPSRSVGGRFPSFLALLVQLALLTSTLLSLNLLLYFFHTGASTYAVRSGASMRFSPGARCIGTMRRLDLRGSRGVTIFDCCLLGYQDNLALAGKEVRPTTLNRVRSLLDSFIFFLKLLVLRLLAALSGAASELF